MGRLGKADFLIQQQTFWVRTGGGKRLEEGGENGEKEESHLKKRASPARNPATTPRGPSRGACSAQRDTRVSLVTKLAKRECRTHLEQAYVLSRVLLLLCDLCCAVDSFGGEEAEVLGAEVKGGSADCMSSGGRRREVGGERGQLVLRRVGGRRRSVLRVLESD